MAPATKICSTCRAVAPLYAPVCDRCGSKFPAQTFPEEDPVSEAPGEPVSEGALIGLLKQHAQLLICLLGILLSIAGLFMPLMGRGPVSSSVTFMRTVAWPLMFVLSGIALVCALFRRFTGVACIGSVRLTLLCISLIPMWRRLNALPAVEANSPYRLHLQYGWLVLILSCGLMLLGGAYDLLRQPADPQESAQTDRKRRRFLLACVAGAGVGLLLALSSRALVRAPRSSQSRRRVASGVERRDPTALSGMGRSPGVEETVACVTPV